MIKQGMKKKMMRIAFSFFSALFFAPTVFSDCVVSPKANLRKGPGTQYQITWVVGKYMPLQRLRLKGRWAQVKDLDGQTHWTSRKHLSTKISCVVVHSKYTFLHKGPGLDFSRASIPLADKYTPFKSLGGEDGWLQVVDSLGNTSWTIIGQVWRPRYAQQIDF